MRQYDIVIKGMNEINFAPESETLEIIQNIRTIITTAKYSVPLFREFGADGGIVDEAMNLARAKFKSDIIMAVRKYEPRANISRIEIEPDSSGAMAVRLSITV